jgi:hypothetical protein
MTRTESVKKQSLIFLCASSVFFASLWWNEPHFSDNLAPGAGVKYDAAEFLINGMNDPRKCTKRHEIKPTRNVVRDVSCNFVDRIVLEADQPS